MPGILPMKVIKVGSNAQTRIAQACDRCRSKKIRCDGIRPSCTQCTNVGFECKTSDKLSRRAFPRGYTESLEERVRALESEVRELKDLLDEKDEKIDMLSRLHSHSSPTSVHSRATPSQSPLSSIENKEEPVEKDDGFKVQQSPVLLDDENCDSYFIGNSSGRALVDAFKRKVQETGKPGAEILPEAFFHAGPRASEPLKTQQNRIVSFKAPPRLVSDQLINIFFQEWAPLFPIVHRPTFLALYEQYVASPETMEDKKSIATLNLVFSIAALSNDARDTQTIESFDTQWRAAMETFLMDNSLAALQCFILAQISCLLSADYPRLLKFKGLAISLSYRLGLHQSQKRFALGALTMETRKKVFWTLYTVDCLSAAQLGVPRLIKEEDVQCEYPVDADDEYVTEKGFLPSLPGECTKISSALALFRLARVLSKVLSNIYPANASYEISFKTMNTLSEELDAWLDSLPNHLRLTFAQDKPSTNVTGSRSPVLSLVYHYTRTLIYRPAACANLGDRGSSATIALSSSCKHLVQIVELLDERKLSFSVALNRKELLLLCGFGILFQLFGIDQESRLAKDCHRMTLAVNDLLERSTIPSIALAFRRVSYLMLSGRSEKRQSPPTSMTRHSSESSMHAPQEISQGAFRATQKHLKAIAQCFSPASMSRFTKSGSAHLDGSEMRRATVPNVPSGLGMHGNQSSASLSSIRSEPSMSPQSIQNSLRQLLSPRSSKRPATQYKNVPNLDYLAFDARQQGLGYGLPNPDIKGEFSSSDWERLLGSLDNGQTNIFDSIYGGPTADALIEGTPMSASTDSHLTWSPELWNAAYDLMPPSHMPHAAAPPPQSVLSFSDESLTSGDDFAVDFSSVDSPSGGERTYPGIVMPELSPPMLGGMDGNFGL